MSTTSQWSKRELERQFKTALFERSVLHQVKASAALQQTHPMLSVFKDSYLVEFLDLQPGHLETDLHQGLLQQLKNFLIGLGRDFCFVGSEFPLRVGRCDFALDLLFMLAQSRGRLPEDFAKKENALFLGSCVPCLIALFRRVGLDHFSSISLQYKRETGSDTVLNLKHVKRKNTIFW